MTTVASRATVEARVLGALAGGGRIAFPPALGEPELTAWLVERLPDRPDVEVLQPYRTRTDDLGVPPQVRLRAHFGGAAVDRSAYAPIRYGRLAKAIRPGGPLEVDVALVRVSPPDAAGRHSVGPSTTLTGPLVRSARLVVAEVHPELPRTCGPGSLVDGSDLDLVIDADRELSLPAERPAVASEQADRIARYVATLVPDDVTVQVGLGRNAQALLGALRGRRRLRLLCGMLSDELVSLIESGDVDRNEPTVVGEAIGGPGLMAYIDGNEGLSFETSQTLHHPGVLARHPRFVTINSVVEVDLLGRANCEFVGDRVVGGLGGLTDFLEAGVLSDEGGNILVVPTDPRTGQVRIVDELDSADVSVARSHVDHVVTEFGIADLRGATTAETRERLLAVAGSATVARLVDPS